jgi:hypothetical protein
VTEPIFSDAGAFAGLANAELVLMPTRTPKLARERRASYPPVRCISTVLDKNRRYMGTSQSKRPPKRTPRTPHLLALHKWRSC